VTESIDLVIVGAGPAGLAASLYAARARLNAVTIDRMGAGGQLVNVDRIENYPGFVQPVPGFELGPALSEQAMNAGARIELGEVTGVKKDGDGWLVRSDEEFHCRAVIIAAGSSLAKLGVPGESEFEGSGVSYCATCDGDFYRDLEVAVVGGGDSALDEAEYLSTICSTVHMLQRGPELTGSAVLQERARSNPKIDIELRTAVEAIEGSDTVEALVLQSESGEQRRLEVPGVFIYVGLRPNTDWLGDLLPLDPAGHIPTDIWMATPQPGIFAAGDIRQHSARQIASCVGDGVTAAIAAERYLRRASP
jgi:thioredoxin reductase (NADPH)